MKNYALKYYSSPIGLLRLIADEQYLMGVIAQHECIHRLKHLNLKQVDQHPILDETQQQLNEYFQKTRQSFDLPLCALGTHFQQTVWEALKTIPYAQTRSYQDIAKQIGQPNAMRAVGMANKQNPHTIIVPCHRVIGKNGALVGFNAGIKHKMTLLQIEANENQC